MNVYSQHIREEDGARELYPFDYLEFYGANIHPYEELQSDEGSKKIYEGITVMDFRKQHKEGFMDVSEIVFKDKRLSELQEELEKEDKQVCMFNIYILSMFLVERGKTRYVFLLKPKIQETLSALNNVSKITFTNENGTTVESNSDILIKKVLEVLETNKECDTNISSIEKFVTWDEVANNVIMQSYFVHDLSVFLNKYFPIKRKKDALVSTTEVELILYLMKLFEMSKEELTNKRYFQLMSVYKKINNQVKDIGEFIMFGEKMTIPLLFIPYSIWSKGKIDWTDKDLPRVDIKVGDFIKF